MTTSKNLMHSNDHIKGYYAGKGGGTPQYPPLGETLYSYMYEVM